jgi:hypothetical protein
MPGWEEDGRMGAVTGLIVPLGSLNVIPGDERAPMDTGDLIPAQELALIDVLQTIQRQKVQVPLVRVLLQLADFET